MPVYWRRGGSATFDLLLQNSSITKQKSIGSFIVTLMNSSITKQKGIGSFIVTLMNSPITKQKGIGSFIVTLMNSPITKRCFVIAFSPCGRRTSFLSKAKNLLFRDIFKIPIAMITRNRRSPTVGSHRSSMTGSQLANMSVAGVPTYL